MRTIVESDSTGGLNKAGSVVLLVPQKHEPLMLGGTLAHWLRVRLLRPQPGQPTLPGVAADRVDRAPGASASPCPPSTPSAQPAELLGRSDGRHRPVVPRLDDPRRGTSRRRARRGRRPPGHAHVAGGAGLLRVRAERPARRVGLQHRRGAVRPRDPAPRRRGPPARRDPAGRRRDPRHRLPLGRRRARQRGHPDAHRAAHRAAVRRVGDQPGARDGRGRRRDRRRRPRCAGR